MKNEKMNDKGFSLVELIIVIAIMAVLVVVLAPQYLKYVERARNATDTSNATEIVTALQVYAADPDAKTPFVAKDEIEIKVEKDGGKFVTDAKGTGAAALTNAGITIDDVKCKSKTKWTDYTIKATVKDDGELTIEYKSTHEGTGDDPFATAMNGKTVTSTNTNTNTD